ncbi:conserved hypothetical protein [groundwater metagenome]|uniref:Conserved hypothetical protein CHP02391 domain-containing protein n=1 Tax=groundwater metagenome TaxID=717931 RepID=A0A098EBD0_9ZZZZ
MEKDNGNKLRLTFDPNTIEHLGVRMYSTLPPVLAELIANAYDADAEHVWLNLNDEGNEKEIIIEDDGIGMSFDEINDKFLRIGRARRSIESETTQKRRKIIGKKGLGKLSFFGVAHEIEIITKKNREENAFSMFWEDIKKEDKEYNPKIIKKDYICSADDHGTKITLRKIQRESDFSADNLANSISKLFIIDLNFKIIIQHNSEEPITVGNEIKYIRLEKEVEWKIPDDCKFETTYEKRDQVVGRLIATKKPISPKTNIRGITLFSRKKLVNNPEYFSDSTSSHFFSYLTGWLEVDFIDDLEDDVITTNRQSLNWGHPEIQNLRIYLQNLIRWLEQDWRKKRGEIRENKLSEATGVNIPEWFSKLPDDIREKIEPIIETIVKDSELPEETNQKVVKDLHKIIPEYPYYHWRHLHSALQKVVFDYYKNEDFYTAVFEGAKRYINELKRKSGESITDRDLIENVFSLKDPKLLVTKKYKKLDGNSFDEGTITNIKEGHRMLALAMWQAFRCPISHEEVCDLRDSGLFTENDCLDALSLLSHLYRRLENSES